MPPKAALTCAATERSGEAYPNRLTLTTSVTAGRPLVARRTHPEGMKPPLRASRRTLRRTVRNARHSDANGKRLMPASKGRQDRDDPRHPGHLPGTSPGTPDRFGEPKPELWT